MLTIFMLLALAAPAPLMAAEMGAKSSPPKISCNNQVARKQAIIVALKAKNDTLLIQVRALSQLLAVSRRKESDAAAFDAVFAIEDKILTEMGLSATNCEIQIDGIVNCKTITE